MILGLSGGFLGGDFAGNLKGPFGRFGVVRQHDSGEQFDPVMEDFLPIDNSLGSVLHLAHNLSTGGDVLDESNLTEGRIGGGVDCLGVG